MKNLKHIFLACTVLFMFSCGGDASTNETEPAKEEVKIEEAAEDVAEISSEYGVGPFAEVELGDIDETMAAKGMEVYKAKCSACHK